MLILSRSPGRLGVACIVSGTVNRDMHVPEQLTFDADGFTELEKIEAFIKAPARLFPSAPITGWRAMRSRGMQKSWCLEIELSALSSHFLFPFELDGRQYPFILERTEHAKDRQHPLQSKKSELVEKPRSSIRPGLENREVVREQG